MPFKLFLFFIFPFSLFCQNYIIDREDLFSKQYLSHIQKYQLDSSSKRIILYPRFLLNSETNKTNNINQEYSLLGIGAKLKISNNLIIDFFGDRLFGEVNEDLSNFQDSLGFYPGFNNKQNINLIFKYKLNSFILSDFGVGKHFIGEGYRSLILSDIGASYPYLKLNTKFGNIKYYNLYTTFLNPNMVDFGRKKHAAIHYLSYDISKYVNIGIFESILWQSKSELANNGFELAYFNPVIFYRPVEFSKQSNKANALMGITSNVTISNFNIYTQFLLDDLNISRQRDSDDNYEGGFFQNKFGYQIGLKASFPNSVLMIEYNQVQPYTYGHRTVLQNYSHLNQALAHPMGANFRELIFLYELRLNNWEFKFTNIFNRVGLDSLNTHYGQNIFESDFEASTGGQLSYGNYNGQGISTDFLISKFEISRGFDSFNLFFRLDHKRRSSVSLTKADVFFVFGVRNYIFDFLELY